MDVDELVNALAKLVFELDAEDQAEIEEKKNVQKAAVRACMPSRRVRVFVGSHCE